MLTEIQDGLQISSFWAGILTTIPVLCFGIFGPLAPMLSSRIGVERARAVEPEIKLGICGEHGGDEKSVGFCHRLGLDYVSCSPYRVPLARLAAAQAALAEEGVTAVAVGG